MSGMSVEDLQAMQAAENGDKSIEALAEEGFDAGSVGDDEPTIAGSNGQLSLKVGGRKPDESMTKMKSTQVRTEGQFEKGETMAFKVIGRVDDITFRDSHDDYGNVTTTKRIHIVRPIAVERLDGEE